MPFNEEDAACLVEVLAETLASVRRT